MISILTSQYSHLSTHISILISQYSILIFAYPHYSAKFEFYKHCNLLTRLFIQNYALIKKLEVALEAGLITITGETGAGKSIILGAIGLLKGERADTKALLNTEEKCLIEAVFQVQELELQPLFEANDLPYEPECILRREIAPNGRSRAFINDSPVTLEVLSIVAGKLLDIHSQHDTLLLENQSYQLEIIDVFAQNQKLKTVYVGAYQKYTALNKQLVELEALNNSSLKSNDFDAFLLKELTEAKLEEGEEELLKAELNKIEHAEEIKLKLNTVKQQLEDAQYGVLNNLKSASGLLDKVSNYDTSLKTLRERISSSYEELRDVLGELESKEESITLDEEKAEITRQRLDLIYGLQTKHRVSSVKELIHISEELSNKLAQFSNLEEKIAALQVEVKKAQEQTMAYAQQLSQSRLEKTAELSQRVEGFLKNISIPNAEVVVEHHTVTPHKNGIDQFEILFSANKGVKAQKLKNVASGGEFSRLMLCIKYILAEKKALPTLIFDEIDTGVSGDVALKMAQMMKDMSRQHQVLTITHLPQMAAFGSKHLYVYKDNSQDFTTSNIKELKGSQRTQHLAEMIGGANPSSMALASAQELIDNYSN